MTLLAMFRCSHPRLTVVFTIGGHTYQVCLECGAELEYDLETMQPTGELVERPRRHPDYVHIARARRKLQRGTQRDQLTPERSTTR